MSSWNMFCINEEGKRLCSEFFYRVPDATFFEFQPYHRKLTHLPGSLSIKECKMKQNNHLNSQLNSILKVAPVGIGLVVDRTLTFVNDLFVEMVGYSREELIGNKSRMFYPSDEEFERVGKYKYQQII